MPSPRQTLLELLLLVVFAAPLAADVSVTQLANEGVMLSDGETRILIDAFVVEPYSVYGGLPPDVVPHFEQLSGPFGHIDLALASHRHHDHNQPRFACAFLQASTETHFHSGSQVIGLMRERCRDFVTTSPRVHTIDPQYFEPVRLQAGSADITVFPLSHGTRKYARIQNYGHLVELGGLKLLHIGDAAMNPEDFARAGLDGIDLDVAFIPFWFFQPGPGAEVVEKFMDARFKIAVHIPPGEMAEVREYMARDYPQVMILEKTLDQAVFSSAAPPPPP